MGVDPQRGVCVRVAEPVLGLKDLSAANTRTVATECRSRCKVTSGIPAAAHSWANQCPSPPVVNRLPWLGSAENNHGPNWSLPDLALHAWMLTCHRAVLVGPNVKRRTVLVLVGPITSPDAARSIVRTRPSRSPS